MRVLLDADTPVQMLDVLQHVLQGHDVTHVHKIRWSKKKDVPLLRDAARRGYEVFVTNDSNQLNDPDETTAIKSSKLHHVRYAQRQQGLVGLGLAIGAVVAAMPVVIRALEEVSEQQLIQIKGLDTSGRFQMTNPRLAPPRYWR